MKRLLITPFALALLVATMATSARADEKVWAFGDSLSDNGNLSLLFATDEIESTYLPPEAYKPYFPPELGGQIPLQRISTGKITTEYIAEYYGTTLLPSGLVTQIGPVAANNFAISFARATLTSQLDLPYQVAQFAGRVAAGVDVSDDRAVILIGSNDILAAWVASIEPIAAGGEADMETGNAILDEALASLRSYLIGEGGFVQLADGSIAPVPALTALGLSKFVMLNVPALDATPEATQTGDALGNRKEVVRAARKLTRYFNRGLKKIVKDMKKADLDVASVDIYKLNRKFFRNAKKLGFINTTDDCFKTNTLTTLRAFLSGGEAPAPQGFRDTCSAEIADEFTFIDTVHPTGAVHKAIADWVLERLPSP